MIISRRSVLLISLGSAAALALSGCSLAGLTGGPPPDLYVLSPKSTFPPDLPRVSWQLVVEEPSAARGLDTDRIAIAPTDLEVKYFADARWADRAPRMVQSLLIQSFENTQRIVSVGRQQLGLRSDFVLKSELREFQAEKRPDGTRIRVRLNVKLVRPLEGIILASQTFESTKMSKSDLVSDVVENFDDALGTVLKRSVSWALIEGAKVKPLER
jgi:cholesterol transport system auxiliary component